MIGGETIGCAQNKKALIGECLHFSDKYLIIRTLSRYVQLDFIKNEKTNEIHLSNIRSLYSKSI